MYAYLCFFSIVVGIVVALRFKVFALFIAIILELAFDALIAMGRGLGWETVWLVITTVGSLNVGYICGSLLRGIVQYMRHDEADSKRSNVMKY